MTISTDRPNPFVTIWAEKSDKKNQVSETAAEALGKHEARASMELGFPEITMKSAMRGGQPPWGEDHNGILNRITQTLQWIQAGGTAVFDQELCDKMGGYPECAILQDITVSTILWFSIKPNNTFNPIEAEEHEDGKAVRKRECYWEKLSIADIKDLQSRLAIAEGNISTNTDHIKYINEESTKENENVNSFPDVYAKLDKKAQREGSCEESFRAEVMSAKQYSFCPMGDDYQNTIFQEIKGEVKLYTDTAYRVYVKDSVSPILSIENAGMRLCDVKASQIYLKATEWIDCHSAINIYDDCAFAKKYYDGVTETNKTISWSVTVDYYDSNAPKKPAEDDPSKYTKDLTLTLWDNRPDESLDHIKEGTRSFIAMKVSYDTGDIHALTGAFVNGPYGDLAEYYQADREDYEPGILMCHGIDTEAILCQSVAQSDDFFGVVSTKPGYVMNGNAKGKPNSVLIALNGKVPVKVKGVVKCGDKITIGQDGYGVVSKNKNDVIVGRAKEDKVTEDIGLVFCYVQAHI